MIVNKKILIILFVPIALSSFAAWSYQHKQKSENIAGDPPKSEQSSTLTSATSSPKIYRSEDWGFEFKYPEGWEVEENSVRTVSSKFNLILKPIGESYQPFPPVLLNIVTADFGDYTFQDLDKMVSEINIDGVMGKRYDYKLENIQRISILLPFGSLRIIFGAGKGYENAFNQIITTFKFLRD